MAVNRLRTRDISLIFSSTDPNPEDWKSRHIDTESSHSNLEFSSKPGDIVTGASDDDDSALIISSVDDC
jgi:hypothetical protein